MIKALENNTIGVGLAAAGGAFLLGILGLIVVWAMPPSAGWRISVPCHSMIFTPFIHVVMWGGLFSMRARNSFHWPWRQK